MKDGNSTRTAEGQKDLAGSVPAAAMCHFSYEGRPSAGMDERIFVEKKYVERNTRKETRHDQEEICYGMVAGCDPRFMSGILFVFSFLFFPFLFPLFFCYFISYCLLFAFV